jgi:hypothetical protein
MKLEILGADVLGRLSKSGMDKSRTPLAAGSAGGGRGRG